MFLPRTPSPATAQSSYNLTQKSSLAVQAAFQCFLQSGLASAPIKEGKLGLVTL